MKYFYWLIGLIVLGGIGWGSYYLGRSASDRVVTPSNLATGSDSATNSQSGLGGLSLPDMSGLDLFGNNALTPTPPTSGPTTSTPNNNTSTKTYTSRTYSFAFRYPTEAVVFDDFLWPAFRDDEFSDYLTGGSVTLSSQHDDKGELLDGPIGPNGVYMQIGIWRLGKTNTLDQFLSDIRMLNNPEYTQTNKVVAGLTGEKFTPSAADIAAGASTYVFIKRGDDLLRFEYVGNATKIQAILDSVTL